MNFPTSNSNIGDVALLDSMAANSVFIRCVSIQLYGSDLSQAAETFENTYEHLDEHGIVAELPLNKKQIIDVITTRLYAMCEEWLRDIGDHATRDRILKEMIERKVKLDLPKHKQAA